MANNPELLKMPLARDGQKSTIPETTDASTGLFSQQYGWQSINSLPPQAGGKAVKREDFNGAFNLLGGVAFMAQKGFTFKWSAEQDYYAGCVVIDDTDGLRYECIADVTANSTAPSADATHWQIFSAGTDIDAWFRQPSTAYAVGDVVYVKGEGVKYRLACVTAGTTSADELSTSLKTGQYITDGTVTWIVEDVRDGLQVGDIKLSPVLRKGYVKANGALLTGASTNYPRLVAFVQENPTLAAADDTAWADNKALYVYDDTNDTLRVPDATGRVLQGGASVQSVEAGLPNVTGSTTVRNYNVGRGEQSGAFSSSDNGSRPTSALQAADGAGRLNFDASLSNPIYSASTTVQPPALSLIAQIKY